MNTCTSLLADLNVMCKTSFDLYAFQFVSCIWGKFVKGLARPLQPEPRDAACTRKYGTVEAVTDKGATDGARDACNSRIMAQAPCS